MLTSATAIWTTYAAKPIDSEIEIYARDVLLYCIIVIAEFPEFDVLPE